MGERNGLFAVEPQSGLPVESIEHLPRGLRETLLRNQQGVAPIVLFVEWVHKLSEGAVARGTKERLLIITPDSVNVYASDGAIKRRVKVVEITSLYAELPAEASIPPSTAMQVGSVCLEVPRQFDMGFDFRRDTPARCRHALMRFVRTLCTLHRYRSTSSFRPLPVLELRGGSLGSHSGSELEYFRLKKAHAAGPHPHGKKGPLLAPVLPLVTEEMERCAEDNVQGQLAQAIVDVTREVQRFRESQSTLPWRQSVASLEKYAARLQACEADQLRVAQKKAFLLQRSARQAMRMSAVETAMGEARCQYVAEAKLLDEIRSNHDNDVQQLRNKIDSAARQQRIMRGDSEQLSARFLETMRHHFDPERMRLETSIAEGTAELQWRKTSLPQRSSLEEELALLDVSLEQLRSALIGHQSLESTLQEAKQLADELSSENRSLEQSVGEALATARGMSRAQEAHVAQVSMTLARRASLARALDKRRNSVVGMREETAEWAHRLESLLQDERYLHLKAEVQHMEDIVSEDIERKITMHHCLARSAVQTLSEHISLAESKENALRSKLSRLRDNRFALQ